DLDEALIRRIGEVYGTQDLASWHRLADPANRQERRQRQLFRDDVRAVKERLSRQTTAELHIPVLERDVHVTREEFEGLARPLLEETVRLTAQVAGHGDFPRDRIAGVFLVGGASRIPLVSTLVHRGLQIAPTAIEQPELVVAEGSIQVHSVIAVSQGPAVARAPAPARTVVASHPGPVGPVPPGPVTPRPVGPPPSPRGSNRLRRWIALGAAAAVVVALAVVGAVRL